MILTIIRGLPGSGKSTYAHKLSERLGAILIEPDMFLKEQAKYQYSAERYARARILAQEVMLNIAVTQPSDIIYADVLPRRRDVNFLIYSVVGFTEAVNYTVFDLPLITREESIARNRHNVRPEDIDRMISAWEPYLKDYTNMQAWNCSGLRFACKEDFEP